MGDWLRERDGLFILLVHRQHPCKKNLTKIDFDFSNYNAMKKWRENEKTEEIRKCSIKKKTKKSLCALGELHSR